MSKSLTNHCQRVTEVLPEEAKEKQNCLWQIIQFKKKTIATIFKVLF